MESLIGPGPPRSQPLQLARPLQDLCLCFYQARMRGSFNSYPDFCLLTLNLVFLSCILITFFPHPHILPGLSHLLTHPTPCSSSFSNNNHKTRQNYICNKYRKSHTKTLRSVLCWATAPELGACSGMWSYMSTLLPISPFLCIHSLSVSHCKITDF